MSTKSSVLPELSGIEVDKNENYYNNLVQNLPAAVYTCDINGYIKFYNRTAVDLWGREPEVGKDLWCGSWKIFRPDGSYMPLDECPMAVTLKEKRPVNGEEIIVERPDGERRNVLPHPQPIFDNNGFMIGAMNMLVDVTENKRIEETNRKLKICNEQLEEFAFAASHDLQEPLRKINLFTSVLLEKNHELGDEVRKYLNKITDSSTRMKNIISGLLGYTIETKVEEEFVPTDLNEVIQSVTSDLEVMILEKNAVINSDPLPEIVVVPSQMNRLFYNLINNSLKFSKKGVSPVVNITYKQTPTFLHIIVSDNGIGFNQSFSKKIFNLFQRLHDNKVYSGTGIGLSLCKKIMDNHKGDIIAIAEENKGAAFDLQFPISVLARPAY